MKHPEQVLIPALEASDLLIQEAQAILLKHLHPGYDEDCSETISQLLALFDGPKQREAQKETRRALELTQ